MPAIPRDITYRPTARDLAASAGHGKFRFYTSAGWLTPYAFACGYIMRRGTDESGAVLEALPHGAGYVVKGCGRWIRGEVTRPFHRLGEARAYFAELDHLAASEAARVAHFAEES